MQAFDPRCNTSSQCDWEHDRQPRGSIYEEESDMSDKRLLDAVQKTGEWKVISAFKQSTFIYGTKGSGSAVVRVLKAWAARPRTNVANGGTGNAAAAKDTNVADPGSGDAAEQKKEQLRRVIDRELNLFDPGRRANEYIENGYQMMDMYYGQAGTTLHTKRNPTIAEFMHYAMDFIGPFNMNQSGRDAYMETFPGAAEGWCPDARAATKYNLTATKEMSRIIRWGIEHFGGNIIFEGQEVYYSQVFDKAVQNPRDTDLEAQELFEFFRPGASTVQFGKGKISFHWKGRETVPTRFHFRNNWKYTDGHTHKSDNMVVNLKGTALRPIWNNFLEYPGALSGEKDEDVVAALKNA